MRIGPVVQIGGSIAVATGVNKGPAHLELDQPSPATTAAREQPSSLSSKSKACFCDSSGASSVFVFLSRRTV
jgi:hypothetical protein